jgi:hypothetical protein
MDSSTTARSSGDVASASLICSEVIFTEYRGSSATVPALTTAVLAPMATTMSPTARTRIAYGVGRPSSSNATATRSNNVALRGCSPKRTRDRIRERVRASGPLNGSL